jgi:TRAP transporter TAXI family solute receptor
MQYDGNRQDGRAFTVMRLSNRLNKPKGRHFFMAKHSKFNHLLAGFVIALAGQMMAGEVLAQAKPDFRISTGRQGGAYYRMGAVISDLLVRSGQVNSATAETSSGAIESARLLAKGTVHIGAMDNTWVLAALAGKKPFNKKIDLVTIAPLGSWPMFFVTLDSSPIKSLDDLRGRRVSVGARNSGMENHARVILRSIGMSFDDIKPLYLSFGPGGRAVKDGKADVQLQCCIPNGAMTELSELAKVRAVPMGKYKNIIIQKAGTYGDGVLPKGAFRGHDADMPSITIVQGWMASPTLSNEAAYLFAKTVLSNLDSMAKKTALFNTAKPMIENLRAAQSFDALGIGAPLHPGAARAFREAGLLK